MKILLIAFHALALAPLMCAQPVITSGGIVNAAGYQSKLAPDTVFVVFGTGLGPAAITAAPAPSYPTSLDGSSISFTPQLGVPILAKVIYTSATQVAGLLPSSTAPGAYAVQITYNGQTSTPQSATVVARSFGIATANTAGTGTAQATIGNVNGGLSLTRFSSSSATIGGRAWTLTPAHPGDTVALWGTGGGADPANDTGGTSGDQTATGNFAVMVGGRSVTPQYAGASYGYPGLWQVNFVLPFDITPDCFTTVQVWAGGELSNTVTLPVGVPGQETCASSPFSPAILAKLDAGASITAANLSVRRFNIGGASFPGAPGANFLELVQAVFNRYTAADWILPFTGPKFGACSVLDVTYPTGRRMPGTASAMLDAGPKLMLSGPGWVLGAGAMSIPGPSGPSYWNALPSGTLAGGTYTMTGSGGTEVGPFTASAILPGSFTVTNWDAITTISRNQPLTVNWTGSGVDQVIINITTTLFGPPNGRQTTIACAVPAGAGTYTIPAAALALLPIVPSTAAEFSVNASAGTTASISAMVNTVQTLPPTLTGGGQFDFGSFTATLTALKHVAVTE